MLSLATCWTVESNYLNWFWCNCGQARRSESRRGADKLTRAPDPIAPSTTAHGAVGRHQMRTGRSSAKRPSRLPRFSGAFLGHVFGREGLILHGGTPVSKRKELVRRFQDDELVPFFVLSLKAGGAGLNLTAASHVVHFDRWWNPAVENQATDRAFRIGQSRNVLVHKFVCQGTVEDKIDQLIESKQTLVKDVLEGGTELQLTELSDKELLNLVALDIHSAQANVLHQSIIGSR